ncbi:MAG TPA: undecaprenyl-diphosphatase UppP [Chloroflexota bacterium]|nr:undecaprenyl-diphosphatase UppP [Chloroflexota bacterium]
MDTAQGALLGVVQGLTEFLPVSSSGHLILVPWLLGWPAHSLTFDVALHMGTLAALILFFWRDWLQLLAAWLPGRAGSESSALDRRLGIGIVVGSLPAAVVGALFDDVIESSVRSPLLVAAVMLAFSFIILAADRLGRMTRGVEAITIPRALAIGLAQALALLPGVSRSGSTISAGLALGLTREAATRYAFLLATPITAGAGLLKLKDLLETGVAPDEQTVFLVGIALSFAVGLAAIGFLLRYVRRASLLVFVIYRIALALLVVGLAALRA